MKLSDFILQDEQAKKATLLHQGILLGKRKNEDQIIFLFQLDSFYIEMYCNISDKTVQEFLSFEGTSQLQPYLDAIQIDHLFQHP